MVATILVRIINFTWRRHPGFNTPVGHKGFVGRRGGADNAKGDALWDGEAPAVLHLPLCTTICSDSNRIIIVYRDIGRLRCGDRPPSVWRGRASLTQHPAGVARNTGCRQ